MALESLHICYTAPRQPATLYRIYGMPGRLTYYEHSPYERACCYKCKRVRLLKHLDIITEAYYDPMWVCRPECPPKRTWR
jgi:hypothetical protein